MTPQEWFENAARKLLERLEVASHLQVDRILDRDPRSEALIAELVDRGIDPHELDRLLERRRRVRSNSSK